jgi:integrase
MSHQSHLDEDLPTGEPLSIHALTTTQPFQQQLTITGVGQVSHCSVKECPHLIHLPADGVIVAWLNEKTGKSQSWKTHVAYHAAALSLRSALQLHGYDLFTDLSNDQYYASYLLIVQQWAGLRAETSRHKGTIAASTYNHRLATISSLFEYAKRMRLYRGDNPIDAIARRSTSDQEGAKALHMIEMRKRLARIERKSLAGNRDYALLSVALQTGCRVQALADMRISDLAWSDSHLTIHFPRTKGGETDDWELETETTMVLADYLCAQYGERWHEQKQAPVWVSYARNGSRGMKLTVQALEQISKKHIGTSQFHTMRHTAGVALDDLGVPTSEVQAFLRHKNISTTSAYLKRQKRARNKYGRDLEQVFGITATHNEDVG